MKFASNTRRGEIHRPFGIKNLQIPLSRLSIRIDFYFMYSQALTNPFSTNPFLSTSIQNPRGVHAPRPLRSELSALGVADFCNGFVISSLPPLVLSLLSFSFSCRLFSIVCRLFPKTRGWGYPAKTVGQAFLAVLRRSINEPSATIDWRTDDLKTWRPSQTTVGVPSRSTANL